MQNKCKTTCKCNCFKNTYTIKDDCLPLKMQALKQQEEAYKLAEIACNIKNEIECVEKQENDIIKKIEQLKEILTQLDNKSINLMKEYDKLNQQSLELLMCANKSLCKYAHCKDDPCK